MPGYRLIQLVAYGASDIYLTGSPCNINNSIELDDDINYKYDDIETVLNSKIIVKHTEEIIFDIIYFNIRDIFIINKYNYDNNIVYI
jgi:hypothetical protein